MASPRHGFITWAEGTTQPNVVVNDLIDNLDVKLGLSVISATTTAQPVSPTEGDCYIIPASATGTDWSTYTEKDVAVYRSGAWTKFTPINGWVAYVADDTELVVYNGSWTAIVANILNNLSATTAPTSTDDSGSGYGVGSHWIDITNDRAFICVDATSSAAVWLEILQAGPLNKYDATADPTTGDDNVDGYSVGSVWANVTDDKAFMCLDASTDAAVWIEITAAGSSFDGTAYVGVNNQTGTAYTLVLGDAGYLITMNNAAANTLTIPANSSVAFAVGTRIDVLQLGAGQTTVAITTDTLNGEVKINAQWEMVSLIKISSTTWVVVGGVA